MSKKEGFAPMDETTLEVWRSHISGTPKLFPQEPTTSFSLTEFLFTRERDNPVLREQNETIEMVSRGRNSATITSLDQRGEALIHNQIEAHSNGDLFTLVDNRLVNITERMAELGVTAASINQLVLDSASDRRLDITEQQEIAGLINMAIRVANSTDRTR